jgi:hypothetical protein
MILYLAETAKYPIYLPIARKLLIHLDSQDNLMAHPAIHCYNFQFYLNVKD